MISVHKLLKHLFLKGKVPDIACQILFFLLISFALPSANATAAENQIQKAISLLELKDYAQALDLLHVLEESLPDPTLVSPLLAVAYLGRGFQLLASGDFSASREAFQEGRRYNEKDVQFWQGEAMAWFNQGHYADAVSLLDQALSIAPQNVELYILLGKAYYADGRMFEALDALTEAVAMGGGDGVNELLAKVQREWQVEQAMEQEIRGHFQLSFVDNGHAVALASAILEALEDAYADLGSDLSYYPAVRVPVLLYSAKEFAAVTNSPDWAGAVYDGKIRFPLGGVKRVTDPLKALLYHEYMHVLVHFMANGKAPVWLNEGLAELAGRRLYPLPLTQLQKAADDNQLIGWDNLAKTFTALEESKVLLAYEQSYSLAFFMIDRFGWHKMTELLEALGKRQGWASAVTAVYHDYGLDWPAILVEWQASINR
jgi:tetratricopeptide (TPR) repeat protein